MSAKHIKRTVAKDKPNRRNQSVEEFRCRCANRLFRVFVEPIRRKERTKQSPDFRIGIECPICKAERRIHRGAPN